MGGRNITKTRTTYQSSCEQLSRSRRGGVAAEFSAEFRVLGYVAFRGEISEQTVFQQQQQTSYNLEVVELLLLVVLVLAYVPPKY